MRVFSGGVLSCLYSDWGKIAPDWINSLADAIIIDILIREELGGSLLLVEKNCVMLVCPLAHLLATKRNMPDQPYT